MATLKSDFAKGLLQLPQPSGSEVISVRMAIDVAALIAIGDVLQFGQLPDGCVVTDWIIDNADVDTGNTLTVDLGLLNAAGTAISSAAADGGKWLTASTALQAASATRFSAQTAAIQTALLKMTKTAAARMIAMVGIAAATSTVLPGQVGLTVSYRAANGAN